VQKLRATLINPLERLAMKTTAAGAFEGSPPGGRFRPQKYEEYYKRVIIV
jgi:hypothetical protein